MRAFTDAVGGEEFEGADLPGRLANEPQPLWSTADEDVAADAVAAEQPRTRLAHRVQPLEAHLQAERDFLRAWILLRVLRKQAGRI